MALIDNEEAAKRLARVILSDIEIYQQKKIQSGEDLSAELAEGRALFQKRVVPGLVSLFEAVAATRKFGAANASTTNAVTMSLGASRAPAIAPAPVSDGWFPGKKAPPSTVPPPSEPAVSEEMDLAETGPSTVPAELAQVIARDALGEAAGAVTDGPASDPAPFTSPRAAERPARDGVTPVPAEDVVERPALAAPEPELRAAPDEASPPPPEESTGEVTEDSTTPHERITVRNLLAVPSTPEPESITLPPPEPRPATPPPFVAAERDPGPVDPIIAPGARVPPPAAALRGTTPVPQPTAFQSPPLHPVSLPVSLPPSPGTPDVPPADDVVNLRAKTSKVVVLLVIVAIVAGVLLAGRFLTRFL